MVLEKFKEIVVFVNLPFFLLICVENPENSGMIIQFVMAELVCNGLSGRFVVLRTPAHWHHLRVALCLW